MIGETKDARSVLSRAFLCSLGEQINASSRSSHFLLNRLIVNRLPLALPPNVTDPSIYIFGLLHIAPLYTTFESIWESLLDTQKSPVTLGIGCDYNTCDQQSHHIDTSLFSKPLTANDPSPVRHVQACPRIHSLLAHLHLPDLLRSMRLRADIISICRISETELDEQLRQISESGEVAGKLRKAARHLCYSGMLIPTKQFIRHIQHSVETNPHVLLAYAWVFYMALFSGGRFIRATLRAAGLDFWRRVPVSEPFGVRAINETDNPSLCSDKIGKSSPELPFLSNALGVDRTLLFFGFPDDRDGEGIKLEFKKRFAEVNMHLKSGEIEAIVQESQEIFKFLIRVVKDLDRKIGQ